MLIALPNPGGDFTLTLFLPNVGDNSFESLSDETSVVRFFETYFPDAAALMISWTAWVTHLPAGVEGISL